MIYTFYRTYTFIHKKKFSLYKQDLLKLFIHVCYWFSIYINMTILGSVYKFIHRHAQMIMDALLCMSCIFPKGTYSQVVFTPIYRVVHDNSYTLLNCVMRFMNNLLEYLILLKYELFFGSFGSYFIIYTW